MEIYCVAKTAPDHRPSIFKLIRRDKLLWRYEFSANTYGFFKLEDMGVTFFKPARIFKVELIKFELLVEFEESDLDEHLLCGQV